MNVLGQNIDSLTELLALDTQYCFLQFHDHATALKFQENFKNCKNERIVICHYGASHIQSEIVTTKASQLLKNEYGNAGPGFLFPFSAADSYDGINYKSTHTGKWDFAKSYQLPPKIPLGIRGMTIQTEDTTASVKLKFKEKLPPEEYQIILLFESHDSTPGIEICIDSICTTYTSHELTETSDGALCLNHNGEISAIQIRWKNEGKLPSKKQKLRLYGVSVEHLQKKGILYHPMGVGASPFQAVLHLEKLTDHSKFIEPDIVIIDYGTNNILYTNEVPSDLSTMVKSAVERFKSINPDVSIILTSTQDLFYKKKHIDAAITFNQKMDSLARIYHCLYWNFYDLSGGFMRIKDWREKGYAKEDHIHLTTKGYELKGLLLYNSIMNTLNFIDNNPKCEYWRMPVCHYEELLSDQDAITPNKKLHPKNEATHIVKSGDTLSKIAVKNHTTVSRLKKLNHLRSDQLKIGQRILIR
jgi:LysM repeat protein